MKEERAIEILNAYDVNHDPEITGATAEEIDEAYEMGVAALKKQIPQEPRLWGDGYYDGELVVDTGRCPSCGNDYEFESEQPRYCMYCGQLLNWEGVLNDE